MIKIFVFLLFNIKSSGKEGRARHLFLRYRPLPHIHREVVERGLHLTHAVLGTHHPIDFARRGVIFFIPFIL